MNLEHIENIRPSEMSKSQKDNYLSEISETVKFIESKSRMVVARSRLGGRGGSRELPLNQHKVSVKQEEEVLELYCTALNLQFTELHCPLTFS